MKLRTRLAFAFTSVTAIALVASFGVAYAFVERDELREIDRALLLQAEKVVVLALERDAQDPRVGDGPGELVEPPSLTIRYAAVYEADGRLSSSTRTFGGEPPPMDSLGVHIESPEGSVVDFMQNGVHLRGVLLPLGSRRILLYAVPRTGVDADLAFLVRIFVGLFGAATVLTWVVAQLLSRGLVRDVDAINDVAQAVASGKLDARVGKRAKGSVETAVLAERLDQMIERLAELVASQRVFVSSAAHELRSPLTSLRGELELALRRDRNAAEYKETIERALADAVTLTTLADDLLAIARSESKARTNARKPTPVNLVIEDAAHMARGNAEARGVTVTVKGAAEKLSVACSRKEVARALRNLLDNAIAHSPPNQGVTVHASSDEESVAISVEDAGEGVRPEDAAFLFAPFWRADRDRPVEGGTGLGLALAREIARAEGGDVVFDPAYSPGARFVLTLPRK